MSALELLRIIRECAWMVKWMCTFCDAQILSQACTKRDDHGCRLRQVYDYRQAQPGCDLSTHPLGQHCQVVGRSSFPVEQLENQMDATCVPAASQTTFVHTTLAPLESNVTLLIPRTSPRIFHLPVACASFTSVTDGQNTMVGTRTA